ncbi:MAG TPA: sigma-54 dependent transcriptional regulator [Polyangia bacterium]|nr:sigma-54 dependent transcriptional regulator [Polyangia bacterium]
MNDAKPRVLVVDDVPDMAETIARYLTKHGFSAEVVNSGVDALTRFAAAPADAVLTDLRMTSLDGLDVLEAIHKSHPTVPVVIMTAFGAIESAIEAMRRGAYHYVTKPFQLEMIRLLLSRACAEAALRRENEHLRQVVRERFSSARLLGESLAMRRLRALIERVAAVTSGVLIIGETGSGKELVARAIHADGLRAANPFVAVNCAALPEALLESELFGHARGAFTGATQARRGLFVEADGGTLFLDEIGDMPLSLQAKLLRVLQSGEVRAVGTEVNRTVDVRCVAATHHDLDALVARGHFREDLFFRLNVLRVRVPPLRERPDDIPQLLEHFLERSRGKVPGGTAPTIQPSALNLLSTHLWPGNVRELENVVERLVVTASGQIIDAAAVKEMLGSPRPVDPIDALLQGSMSLAELESHYVNLMVERMNGDKGRAAEVLGIDLSTLYRRIKQKP